MSKKDYACLKLSEYNTKRLLQLYQGEPSLYDIHSEDYRNRKLRTAALKRIAAALCVDGFGPKEVAAKFKNLRNSYSQELKKLKDSEMSGAGGEDLYVPKVYWFSVMDAFLRPYLYSRPTQTNLIMKHKFLTANRVNAERRQDDYEDIISIQEDQTTLSLIHADENETKPFLKTEYVDILPEEAEEDPSHSNSQETVEEESCVDPSDIEIRGIKRKRSSPSQKVAVSNKQSDTFTAVDKLYEISQLAASVASKSSDMYSHFGEYVASVLRQTGGQKAVLMQQDICNVIFTHLSSLSSNHSIRPHLSSISNTAPYQSSTVFQPGEKR